MEDNTRTPLDSVQVDEVDLDEYVDRTQVPALKSLCQRGDTTLFAAGVADMDFKAAPVIRRALRQRLAHGVFGYERVDERLFPALQKFHSDRYGWSIATEHIIRSPNILNALAMSIRTFSKRGDGVIVQPPVFFDFFDIIGENRRKVVRNDLRVGQDGRYFIDFEDLERCAADTSTKVLFLCNPHNPMGRVWTEQELRRIGDICVAHGVLVVSDEIHGGISYAPHRYLPFASLGEPHASHCVCLISPAKIFNIASLSCSFSIVPNPVLRTELHIANSALTVNKNNSLGNVAMIAAYAHAAPWLKQVHQYLAANYSLLMEFLNAPPLNEVIKVTPMESSFLVWLDCRLLCAKVAIDPESISEWMLSKAKWVVSNGSRYSSTSNGYIRVNIACTRLTLDVALHRLRDSVAAVLPGAPTEPVKAN